MYLKGGGGRMIEIPIYTPGFTCPHARQRPPGRSYHSAPASPHRSPGSGGTRPRSNSKIWMSVFMHWSRQENTRVAYI